ncbi:MAG: CFI-box-CTERM domain-containing protein, partial [Candidatus Bathyarchaeia archaeon]
FTEEYTGRIGAMQAQEQGEGRRFVEYVLPFKPELGYSEPWDLDVVPISDGERIFYTDYYQNQIGLVEIKWGTSIKIYTWDINPGSGPRGIFAANWGLVWFTEYHSGKIGKLYWDVSTSQWKLIEYVLPPGSNPLEIILNSRDNSVWYTDYSRDKIGMLNATTGDLYEYSLAGGSRPWGITMDPDGIIWFAASGGSGYIGRLNPWTREVTEYRGIPTSYSRPRGIALDNHTGTIWFTEYTGHKIGLYVPGENLFYEFPTLTPSSSPSGIALLRKHPTNETLNIYFTEWSGNKIGHLYYGSKPEEIGKYGDTTTKTVSQLTTAVKNTPLAATVKRAPEKQDRDVNVYLAVLDVKKGVVQGLDGTTTVRIDTSYRLSTSTMGTSTSYITEVVHTSTTSTSTSYKYISTVSLTSTEISVSTSTSYVATSSITYTTTFHETVYTSTMSLTQTSTVSRTDTLTTTVYYTKYKSTTSATTTTTETQIVPYTKTRVETLTLTTTTTPATTPVTTPTTTVATTTMPIFTFPFKVSCLIATAAYGSEASPVVQYLRDFRDGLVMKTFAGSSFMKIFNAWYYSFSPYIAEGIRPSPSLRAAVRAALYPLFAVLKLSTSVYHGLSWVNPEFAVVAAGLTASGLIGLIYDTPIILAGLLYARRRWPLRVRYRWLAAIPIVIGSSLLCVALAESLGSTTLMMASTAMLVLSTMIGSALAAALWIADKISKRS